MTNCIGYAGCQAERHISTCAKFDQRTSDLQEMEWLFVAADDEWGYDPDSGREALQRLINHTYEKETP